MTNKMGTSLVDQNNCIKSENVMDFIHEEYLFWEFMAFVIHNLKKTDLQPILADMEENPHKYNLEFNWFMLVQQITLETSMPIVVQ